MKNQAYYDACNFTDAVHVGEGQHDHRLLGASSTETAATATMGGETVYFACEVAGHCKALQKLTVVVDTSDSSGSGTTGKELLATYMIGVGAVVAAALSLL